jgi:phospholipid transport system substrate-binding protein
LGQEPLEAVQRNIEKGIIVLEDPVYENPSRKPEQLEVLWQIMQQAYDFKEFSRKVLGANWNKFNRSQRDEFVGVFSEFLGKFYLGQLQEKYSGQRVSYLSQQKVSDSQALVEIEVSWRKLKIPVTLRLTNRSGNWKVYDLNILGINAAENYRAQLKEMADKASPQQIISRIKEKIAELDEKSGCC